MKPNEGDGRRCLALVAGKGDNRPQQDIDLGGQTTLENKMAFEEYDPIVGPPMVRMVSLGYEAKQGGPETLVII